jgi:hypothetical protein
LPDWHASRILENVARPYPVTSAGVETVLAFPKRVDPLANVRSTILIASLNNIKSAGHYDTYIRHLPGEHRRELLEQVVGTWTPVEAALAHYTACDALGLSEHTATAFGRQTVERIGTSLVGTGIRMAKQAGATPWTFCPHVQRFWARGYDGGGIAVYKLGPKDARFDLIQFSLCASAFYRSALGGWLGGLLQLFCTTLYLHEMRAPRGRDSASYRAQWV